MNSKLKYKLIYEFIWLIGVLAISAIIEYAVIMLFNLHPILSVKIQVLIGLMIVAYSIRLVSRLGKEGFISFADDDENGTTNGSQAQPH